MPYIIKIGYSEYLADDHKRAMEVVDSVSKLYKIQSTHLKDDNSFEMIYGTDHEGVEVGMFAINGYESIKAMNKRRKEFDEQQKILKEKKEQEELASADGCIECIK